MKLAMAMLLALATPVLAQAPVPGTIPAVPGTMPDVAPAQMVADPAAQAVAVPPPSPVHNGPAPGVYKWIDRQGVTRYDDRSADKAQRLTRADIELRKIPDVPSWLGTVPAETVAEAALRCQIAQEREQAYSTARSLYGRDPSGNVYPLSPAQTQLEIAVARRDGQRYCGERGALNLQAEQRAAREREQRQAEAAAPKFKVIPVERR
jgi:hypothetical protein